MAKSFECSNIKLMYTLRRKKRCFVATAEYAAAGGTTNGMGAAAAATSCVF